MIVLNIEQYMSLANHDNIDGSRSKAIPQKKMFSRVLNIVLDSFSFP